jgi:hypothetical protein
MATAPSPLLLPRLRHSDEALVRWAEDLVRGIEAELNRIRTAAGDTGYAITNANGSRTLDPTTATLPQAAQVLASAVGDLQRKGFLG